MKCFYCKKRVWFWQEKAMPSDAHIYCHIKALRVLIVQSEGDLEFVTEFIKEIQLLCVHNWKYNSLWQTLREVLRFSNPVNSLKRTLRDVKQTHKSILDKDVLED